MANYNRLILMGNVTRDPELRTTQGGTEIVKFGLATNRKRKAPHSDDVLFIDCTCFAEQAKLIMQYVTKGSPLFVEGRLDFSTWEAKDGSKRSKHELIVENFQFLRGASDDAKPDDVHPSVLAGWVGKSKPDVANTRRSSKPEAEDYGDVPF